MSTCLLYYYFIVIVFSKVFIKVLFFRPLHQLVNYKKPKSARATQETRYVIKIQGVLS